MNNSRLVTLYSLFAAISTAANLLAQRATLVLAGDGALWLSLTAGTCTGLLTKYVLDKMWIFQHRSETIAHETRSFALYSLAGVLTTAIFWGVELGFHFLFDSESMRYIGGAIGLAIGYVIKYRIDSRFAFRRDPPLVATFESTAARGGGN